MAGGNLPYLLSPSGFSVPKIRSQPAFDFGGGHSFSPSVVFDLVAGEAIDGEVAGVGVRDVQAAD